MHDNHPFENHPFENHPFFSPDPPVFSPGQQPDWLDVPRRTGLPGDFQAPFVKPRAPVAQDGIGAGGGRTHPPFSAVTPGCNMAGAFRRRPTSRSGAEACRTGSFPGSTGTADF